MKHYSLIVVASFAALSLSCNKVGIQTNNDNNGLVTVKGVVSEEVSTKSDYNINWDSHTATFCWKGAEGFSRLGFDGTFIHYENYSGTASDSGQAELSFTGNSLTKPDTDFAFYPGQNMSNPVGWGTGSGKFKLSIPNTSAYDASNPIKGFIPMIGKISGDVYEFSPITGVVAVRMTNIPAEATKITISSPNTAGGFSGNYNTNQLPAGTVTALQSIYDNGLLFANAETASRSFTFSNLNSANTYYFYFPTPIGTLDGLTIELADAAGTFYTATSTKEVTSTRGIITRLPLITIPTTAPTATVTGDCNDRTAIFAYNGADKIKYAISTSSTALLSTLTPTTTTSPSVALAPPASTGTYYLVYQGYKDDETTRVGPEKRVKFLYATSDVSQIEGTYKINNNGNWKLDIAAVDNPAGHDGNNIEITKYYSNNANYNEATGHCYGVFDPANGTITIPSAQMLTKNTYTYYLVAINTIDSQSKGSYYDNLVFTLTEVENNAAIKLIGSHGDKGGLCVATSATGNNYVSGGQHFTSDGSGGRLYLYKEN